MIVLDASVLLELVLHTATGAQVAMRLRNPAAALHVPHLADIEVTQALRRYVRQGELTARDAMAALDDMRALDLRRHPHEPLLGRVWDLRDNLTAYDAVYVALAEVLDGILLTCDGPLSRAPGLRCRVERLATAPSRAPAGSFPASPAANAPRRRRVPARR